MELFNDFFLDASEYRKQAELKEYVQAKTRMSHYYNDSTKPFLNVNHQIKATFKPTNTGYFIKHLLQLVFGAIVAIKTLFTDPMSLFEVFKGMFHLVLTMILDAANFVVSGFSCLFQTIATIKHGYSLEKKDDEICIDDDTSENGMFTCEDDERLENGLNNNLENVKPMEGNNSDGDFKQNDYDSDDSDDSDTLYIRSQYYL